ncbi:MAG: c-type cytochrome [Pseudomonadota bacterium]|nr:c-type cytochrome [Pseudomonadota bacterium]
MAASHTINRYRAPVVRLNRVALMLCFCIVSLMWVLPSRAGAPAATDDRQLSAKQLYRAYCAVCHGDRGDGRSRAGNSVNPPPRDFTSPIASRELTRARMIRSVHEGRQGTAMTAWKSQLNDAQIEAVVDYVRASFMRSEINPGKQHQRGAQIYTKTCSVCHGDRGNSSLWARQNLNPAPRDFASPQAGVQLSRERMIASVTSGRPGTAMMGFARQLSKEDIEAVVDFARIAFMGRTDEASGEPAAEPSVIKPAVAPPADMMPEGLKGDVAQGKRFYLANCATCHGAKGDGNGPRAYFINPKPLNFLATDSRARLNRPALYYAVALGKQGTEMPAWEKVLSKQEIANVAEFVFQDFIAGSDPQARANR